VCCTPDMFASFQGRFGIFANHAFESFQRDFDRLILWLTFLMDGVFSSPSFG
jgi:hypothetical protein